jgi:hypothetical protein
VGLGVGVPTTFAGTVGAISSAANAAIAKQMASKTDKLGKDNLAETKAKNIQDQTNKDTELAMAKTKHDLEIGKLAYEKIRREREENKRAAKAVAASLYQCS